jgi:hypothetical protein
MQRHQGLLRTRAGRSDAAFRPQERGHRSPDGLRTKLARHIIRQLRLGQLEADQHFKARAGDGGLHVGIGERFIKDTSEFVELRAVLAVMAFDDAGGVANHAHHAEEDHEHFGLLFG